MRIFWGKFAISLAICLGAGVIGQIFTQNALSPWYQALHKPSFTPPNMVFGVVWILLFILMEVALYLIWTSEKRNTISTDIFIVQLVLNVLWTIVFFGFHSPIFGFWEIVPLWLAILACVMVFWRVTKVASLLFVPYLLWVGFAAILNLSIALLNK